jgi:hypothetical protein
MRTIVLATVALAALITASASMAPLAASVPASAPANSDYQVVVCYATPENLQPMSLAGIQSVLNGPGALPSA